MTLAAYKQQLEARHWCHDQVPATTHPERAAFDLVYLQFMARHEMKFPLNPYRTAEEQLEWEAALL